jgi:5'-deoxynucleotidase YfbR-like HD superfamily hydrolase
MHPQKWEEYLQCSTTERKMFFDSALESNTALSCFQEKPVASTEITVDKKIIETIIEDLLYLADGDDKTTIQAKNEKLIGFELVHNEDDKIQCYQAIVPNSFQFDA